MMDAIKKPKLKPEANNQTNHDFQPKRGSTAQPNKQTNPKPYTPEMKVWVSVVLSSLIIVGVWIATFSIPQQSRSEPPSTSELKEILLELRNTMKTGVQVVEDQQKILSEQSKSNNNQAVEPLLSNEELSKLAHQLTINTQASTTTSTLPTIQQSQRSTDQKSPKLP